MKQLNNLNKMMNKMAMIAITAIMFIVGNVDAQTVQSNKQVKSKVHIHIDGLGTRLVGVNVFPIERLSDNDKHKIAFCFNNKINFKISIEQPSEVSVKSRPREVRKKMVFRSMNILFYLYPNGEEIVIEGEKNNLSIDYDVIKGNALSFQYSELRKLLLPHFKEEDIFFYEQNKLRKANPKGDWRNHRSTQQFDSVRFFVCAPLRTEWAKNNLNYELSPLYFLESHVPKDTAIKYFNLLSINAR